MSRLYINRLGEDYLPVIREGLGWIIPRGTLKQDSRVSIKPNLTFPVFRKGVMTNPQALEALILYLKDFTEHITICESDSGGYNRFSMDEVFSRTGIAEFSKRYGIPVVNMSYSPSRCIRVTCGRRELEVPLPAFLIDETDLFITMPVPKVHSNTTLSLGMKNQWGVIQEPGLRLQLHPYFKEVIYAINKTLPPTIVVCDGRYGLTRNGPMRGDVVELNWLLVSDNIFVSDYVVSDIIGIDWRRVPHLRYAFSNEGLDSLEGVEFNTDYRAFRSDRFYLRREWTDYPGVCTFHSRFLAYVGYESILARPLHWLLYRFREPFY